MNLSSVRGLLGDMGRRHWGGSVSSNNTSTLSSPSFSLSTQQSDDDFQQTTPTKMVKLSDQEMLERARVAHLTEDFNSLAAGPEANGPWKRVESVGRFVVFRRHVTGNNNDNPTNGLEVMCAGRLDASLEEVSSILRSSSEHEHNSAMTGLYAKNFIFGSYEREVPCSVVKDNSEKLSVKTKSFARTAMLGNNEQWCYFDYFKRKEERDGFTISKRALPATESTPGRIIGVNSRVDQLHGLNASYLVDKIPNRKGLRVVFHAWFETPDLESRSASAGSRKSLSPSLRSSFSLRSKSMDYGDTIKHKVQMRRLLAMASGVSNLLELIRRRRFGIQVPANLADMNVHNTRCPCCTHSLAPVKLSLAKAASAFANRSFAQFKIDTRSCYLCGYLVCVDCWSAQHMETMNGRVAAIVVCTRCQVNVEACEYSEMFAGTAAEREMHCSPPRVIEDSNNSSTVSLLVDFLSASLVNTTAGSPEHVAVVTVIRRLLQDPESDGEEDENNNNENESTAPRFKKLGEEATKELGRVLNNQQPLPALEACTLANAEKRSYVLDLPNDPTVDVPHFPIPSNEADRIAAAKSTGLLKLANCIAPETSSTDLCGPKPDTHDLQVLCQLAAKTLGFSHSFVAIMCGKHEHFLAENHPCIAGTVAPREHTTCQHALMSPYPFMTAHHEADVRFHNANTTKQLHIRSYVGFPLTVPVEGGEPGDEELTVGMFCCLDSKPHIEITRRQYATMKRLASIATSFLLQKARQIEQRNQASPSNCY